MDCGDGFDAVSALEHFAAGKSYDLFPKELNGFSVSCGSCGWGRRRRRRNEEVGRRRARRRIRGRGRRRRRGREGEKGNYLLFPSPPLPLWRTLYSSAGPGPTGISSYINHVRSTFSWVLLKNLSRMRCRETQNRVTQRS